MTITSTTLKNTYTGNGSTTVFAYGFRILAEDEILVTADGVTQTLNGGGSDGYTVSNVGGLSGGNITFNTAPAGAVSIVLLQNPDFTQETDYNELDAFPAESHEAALDRAAIRDLTLKEVQNRTLKYSSDSTITNPLLPEPVDDTLLAFDGTTGKMKLSVTGTDIQNAASNASAAAASASAASTSETNAAASEADALASANAAAAAVASAPFRGIIPLTFADSPYTVLQANNGYFFSIDTSGGSVVVNLPTIASVTLPFNAQIKKETSDANTVTINTSGTDEFFVGGTSLVVASVGGTSVVAEDDTAPDKWGSARFGASAGNMAVDAYADGVDYTSGTTTELTLSANPGSENNTWITFDGVLQHKDTYAVSGTTVTFTSAIPLSTDFVEVVYGTTLSIGVPSDASVTEAKLGSSAVTTDKIQDDAVTTAKILDANVTAAKLAADTSAWKLVESLTASTSANLTFSTGLANYGELLIKFTDVLPATDGAYLQMTASINAGSSFLSSGYDALYASGVIGDAAQLAGSSFRFTSTQGNAASEELSGNLRMTRGSASIDAEYSGHVNYENTTGQVIVVDVSGWIAAGGDVDALRFAYSSGNIASGTITIYGR